MMMSATGDRVIRHLLSSLPHSQHAPCPITTRLSMYQIPKSVQTVLLPHCTDLTCTVCPE